MYLANERQQKIDDRYCKMFRFFVMNELILVFM